MVILNQLCSSGDDVIGPYPISHAQLPFPLQEKGITQKKSFPGLGKDLGWVRASTTLLQSSSKHLQFPSTPRFETE